MSNPGVRDEKGDDRWRQKDECQDSGADHVAAAFPARPERLGARQDDVRGPQEPVDAVERHQHERGQQHLAESDRQEELARDLPDYSGRIDVRSLEPQGEDEAARDVHDRGHGAEQPGDLAQPDEHRFAVLRGRRPTKRPGVVLGPFERGFDRRSGDAEVRGRLLWGPAERAVRVRDVGDLDPEPDVIRLGTRRPGDQVI
jgi:hypothetical protein